MGWRLLADVVVVVHALFIVFVVAGGVLAMRWRWSPLVHLPVVVYGVVIQIVGFTCPLTPLEKALRRRADSAGYDGGFVEHYLIRLVYPGDLGSWVEGVMAALVVAVNLVVYAVVARRTSIGSDGTCLGADAIVESVAEPRRADA